MTSAMAHQRASEPPLLIPNMDPLPSSDSESGLPALQIFCFGRFTIRRSGEPLALCHNRNGQAMFRYLAAHPRYCETMDVLMDALWPDDTPGVARHKLHVATSALRRGLNSGQTCQRRAQRNHRRPRSHLHPGQLLGERSASQRTNRVRLPRRRRAGYRNSGSDRRRIRRAKSKRNPRVVLSWLAHLSNNDTRWHR
jgi:hypothetical protein